MKSRTLSAVLLACVAWSSFSGTARAEEEEDEYGIVYLRLQGGFAYANLLSLSDDNFLPEVESTSGLGGSIGGAAGVRLLFFTLGAQYNYADHGTFSLNDVNLEFAVHIPIPIVQPYVRLSGGYAWLAENFQSDASVDGFRLGIGAGVDIKVHRNISFGFGADLGILNLSREGGELPTSIDVDFTSDGTSVGLQIRGDAHLTVHI